MLSMSAQHNFQPTRQTRQRAYIFKVWVTVSTTNSDTRPVSAMSTLKNGTHPFDVRYRLVSDTSTGSHGMEVPFRVIAEPDTPYRQSGQFRWFHLESAPVVFPEGTHTAIWRIPTSNASQGVRHWCGFEVQHHRSRSADYIQPTAGLQAMYTTFLSPSPFGNDRRTWVDDSGYYHPSMFINGQVSVHDDGGVRLGHPKDVWKGPPTWVLLGESNAKTSTSNNVTPFTICFMYTPSTQVPTTSGTGMDDVSANQTSYRTLFTVYATYKNAHLLDNPPNYFFRVQTSHDHTHMRVVQQIVIAEQSYGAYPENYVHVPLRNDTSDPVLYTLSVTPSAQRGRGDMVIFANAREEISNPGWLDLEYNLNSDQRANIVWGDLQPSEPTNAEEGTKDMGSLYAFLVYNRTLDADAVGQLYRNLLSMYYWNVNMRSNSPANSNTDSPNMSDENILDMGTSTRLDLGPGIGLNVHRGYVLESPYQYISPNNPFKDPPKRPTELNANGCVENDANMAVTEEEDRYVTEQEPSSNDHIIPSHDSHDDTMFLAREGSVTDYAPFHAPETEHSSPPFTYRTDYTDTQYQELTPKQKLNVLQNRLFVRKPRKIDMVVEHEDPGAW